MEEMRVVGPTGRDQTCTPQGEPTFQKGGVVLGRGGLGLVLARFGLRKVPWRRWVGCGWEGRVQDPLPLGPVLLLMR